MCGAREWECVRRQVHQHPTTRRQGDGVQGDQRDVRITPSLTDQCARRFRGGEGYGDGL